MIEARHAEFESVADFTRRQLAGFDLSRLEWFKLLPLANRHRYRGLTTYPQRLRPRSRSFKHQYRVTASVHPGLVYPWQQELAFATRWVPGHEGRLWEYVTHLVTFESARELMVHICGHEAFHFLRHSRQVPGRNTEPSAEWYGLQWLALWREQANGTPKEGW